MLICIKPTSSSKSRLFICNIHNKITNKQEYKLEYKQCLLPLCVIPRTHPANLIVSVLPNNL